MSVQNETDINTVPLFAFRVFLRKELICMRNEKAVRMSVNILVGLTVMILAFVRGTWQLWLLSGLFAVWGAWILGFLPITNLYERIKAKRKNRASLENAKHMLIRHLNKRVTAILRNTYPNASWKWCDAEPSTLALNGGKAYIRVYGVPNGAYGEVTVTASADVVVQFLNSYELPQSVSSTDPYVWYEKCGHELLNNVISDLDSRGVTSLTLSENGDIWVNDERESKFSDFPVKDDWSYLIQILEDNGLDAEIVNNDIVLSW